MVCASWQAFGLATYTASITGSAHSASSEVYVRGASHLAANSSARARVREYTPSNWKPSTPWAASRKLSVTKLEPMVAKRVMRLNSFLSR